MSGVRAGELRDGIVEVFLDVPGRPVNVLDEQVLRDLAAALDAAAAEPGARAIVLRSGKDAGFCAGADVERMSGVRDRAEAIRLARLGQETYARIERLPIPVVAAVHGACVGGGLELALACRGIVASHEPKTRLGLPEVQLGIVPGFGGTQRLPRRIGLVAALELILTGRTLSAKQALRRGLVDDIVCPFHVAAEARVYARELAEGRRPRNERRRSGLAKRLARIGPVLRFVLDRARKDVQARTRRAYPAPWRAIDLVGLAFAGDREAGYAREAEAVGDLLAGDVAHRLIELFLAMEAMKRDAGEGAGFARGDRAVVIGAGVMGAAIARLLLAKDVRVRLIDVQQAALVKGTASIAKAFARDVARGRIGAHEAGGRLDRLEASVRIDGARGAQFAIEAAVERKDVKEAIFTEIAAATPFSTALYTNTSSIPVGSIAASIGPALAGRPLLGMHFFNPVERMPLVEIVVPDGAADEDVKRAMAIVRDLGKVPVAVRDLPGFLVNRVLAPYLAEALVLLEEGVAPLAIDDAMREVGFPMGPLEVLDTVGFDVVEHVSESLRGFLGERLPAPEIGRVLREQGRLGAKAGGGIWTRGNRGRSTAGPWLDAALAEARRRSGRGPRAVTPDDVRDRMLFALLAESMRASQEKLVRSDEALDAALVLGAGFPACLGGPMKEVARRGHAVVRARLDELAHRYGPRFAPPAFGD